MLALLMAGLFSLQLDKGNISYANTTTFAEDIGITPNEINYGVAIQLAGVVIFEVRICYVFLTCYLSLANGFDVL